MWDVIYYRNMNNLNCEMNHKSPQTFSNEKNYFLHKAFPVGCSKSPWVTKTCFLFLKAIYLFLNCVVVCMFFSSFCKDMSFIEIAVIDIFGNHTKSCELSLFLYSKISKHFCFKFRFFRKINFSGFGIHNCMSKHEIIHKNSFFLVR
jgi:hypothetical protein